MTSFSRHNSSSDNTIITANTQYIQPTEYGTTIKGLEGKSKNEGADNSRGLILLTANMLTEIQSRQLTFISDVLNNLAMMFTYM